MVKIEVSDEVFERLNKDRDHFQKVIGVGEWTLSDTISEYFKILQSIEKYHR